MLDGFSWDMSGYQPAHASPDMDMRSAARIFQLEPVPLQTATPNNHILAVLLERDLRHFSFFLHAYEPQLNQHILRFLHKDGIPCTAKRFLDIKLIAVAVYAYQADYEGDWGVFEIDFARGTSEILSLAEFNMVKTKRFANFAIRRLLRSDRRKLPKRATLVLSDDEHDRFQASPRHESRTSKGV